MTFKVEWIDDHREPKCPPDPAYPNGKPINIAKPGEPSCQFEVPYPAKRCGVYIATCEQCGLTIGVTTAGRSDDPTRVTIPCGKARKMH